jgi:hypothetical protein
MSIVGGRLLFSQGQLDPQILTSLYSYRFDSAAVTVELTAGDYGAYTDLRVFGADDSPYAPLFYIAVSVPAQASATATLYTHWFYGEIDGSLAFDYDPQAMAHWRMRSGAAGGVFHVDYQVSPDGAVWRTLHTFQAPEQATYDYQVQLFAYYGTTYLADFNIGGANGSLLYQRQVDGSYVNVGTPERPLRVRGPDGRWWSVDGTGSVPVYQKQPDGTWLPVAYRADS